MSEIVLCCGKVCSGKSTFALRLKRDHGFHHFSSDAWMLHFYEPTPDRQLFDERLAKCEAMIYRVSEELLARGGNVVLDAGFWKRSERDALRARFEGLGHRVSLVYFSIEWERQLEYMRTRNAAGAADSYRFDPETVATLNGFFEEPAPDESVLDKGEYLALLKKP
jgi:predicted kinase